MRSRARQVHLGSLGSLGCALVYLGDAGFIGVRSGGSSASSGVAGFIGVRPTVHRVHPGSGTPWGSSGSIGTVGFTRVRPESLGVHSGWLGSLGSVFGSSGSFGVIGFPRVSHGGPWVTSVLFGLNWVRPGFRWVHSVCFGSCGCVLGVVRFFEGCWIHPGAPWGSSGLI